MTSRVTAARAGIVPAEGGRGAVPGRGRRRTLKQHFCDGLRAAVKAEPAAFAATRPRTMLGLMVQGVVQDAARAKCAAVNLVFDYLEEAERTETDMDTDTDTDTDSVCDDSQGNSEQDTQWDWSADGVWDSSRRGEEGGEREKRIACEKSEGGAEEADLREYPDPDPETEALRNNLLRRFLRAAEAERENATRRARLAAQNGGGAVADVPISGNSEAPATPQPERTIRVGGRLLER